MALTKTRLLTMLTTGALLLATTQALGQPAPKPGDKPSATQPSKEALEEARTRYERGTQLYSEGDYKLALIEFQRAYDLAPTYKVLFNIGQVNLQLGNYAAARRGFEKYLAEGKGEIPDKRKSEVEKELTGLRNRTAHVTIVADVEGAEVSIDGNPAGTTPLPEPLLVDAGQHTVAIKREGRIPATKAITLAGADEVKVEFELPAQAAPVNPTVIAPIRETRTYYKTEKTSYTWVGWLMTGVFTAGATATGIAALALSSDLKSAREAAIGPNETAAAKRKDLDDRQKKARAVAVTTDILGAAAIVTGAITLVFTLKSDKGEEAKKKTGASDVHLGVSPTGVSMAGRF